MQTQQIRLLIIAAVIATTCSAVSAQGGRGRPGGLGTDRLEQSGLKIGDKMPELNVFDSEGKPFKTESLKGKYSVVIFGCLT